MTGVIFDIKRYSIHDGPGIRTTIFLKGCPLSCWWCHNPESQSAFNEIIYRFDRCIGCGACVNACVYHVPQVSNITHVNDVGQKIVQKDKSHKCNACTLNERDVPACVNTCPSHALQFGHRLAMIEKAKERLKEIKGTYPNACIYGLEEFGGLHVITILKDKPEKYGLPTGKDAVAIDIAKAEEVKSIYAFLSIFTLGLPSLKRKAFSIAQSLSSGNRKIS